MNNYEYEGCGGISDFAGKVNCVVNLTTTARENCEISHTLMCSQYDYTILSYEKRAMWDYSLEHHTT